MLRTVVHVVAGATWVLTGAGMLWAALRPRPASSPAGGPDETGHLGTVASIALAVLVVTGVWNATAVGDRAAQDPYSAVLTVKLLLAFSSFAAAALLRRASRARARAGWAALVVLTGAGALLSGVALDAAGGHA